MNYGHWRSIKGEKYVPASELAKAYEAIVELADALKYYASRVDDYRTDLGGTSDRALAANAALIKTAREQGK